MKDSLAIVSRDKAVAGDIVDIEKSFADPTQVRYIMMVWYKDLPKGHFYSSFTSDRWTTHANHKTEVKGEEAGEDFLVFTYTPVWPEGTTPEEPYRCPSRERPSESKLETKVDRELTTRKSKGVSRKPAGKKKSKKSVSKL